MNAIYVLWLRELKHYLRSRLQLAASLAQPLLYLLALGFGLGSVFKRAGGGSYLQFLAPGVIGMTVLFSSVFSGIGLLWDRKFGFLKEMLVAPVPRLQIMIGRTLGSATVAVTQGLLVAILCIVAGFRPLSIEIAPIALVFMILIAVVFSAFGLAIGSSLQDVQGFQLIMNFLVMPFFFLSGALFPLNGLPKILAAAASADPLSYGIDGMRWVLLGRTHYGAITDLIVLAAWASVLLALGAYCFSKIKA